VVISIKLRPRSDFLFTVTAYELATVAQLHELVESRLDELISSRGYPVAAEGPDSAPQLLLDWAQDSVNQLIPAAFRGSVLVALWAVFETTVTTICRSFAAWVPLTYDITAPAGTVPPHVPKAWGRWNVLRRAEYYLLTEVGVELVADPSSRDTLKRLLLLRNVMAHGLGRVGNTKQKAWEQLETWNRAEPSLGLRRGYINPSAAFVRQQIDFVQNATDFVITGARRVAEERGYGQ
jgi:hypothetical protein